MQEMIRATSIKDMIVLWLKKYPLKTDSEINSSSINAKYEDLCGISFDVTRYHDIKYNTNSVKIVRMQHISTLIY